MVEEVLSEQLLTSLKEQGKTDREIAEAYNVSPADVLLPRGWYGIKPTAVKPEKLPPDSNRKPRAKRPILAILRDLREYNSLELAKRFKAGRNEEIYKQYKLGYDIKKLAKMYFVAEQYLRGFVARRNREEEIRASSEYRETKGTQLTRALLQKYKAEGRADADIGPLHNLSTHRVWQLRQKYRIKAAHTYPRMTMTEEMRDMFLEEYRQGKPIDDICRDHGTNRFRLTSLFSRHLTPHDKALRRAIIRDHDGQKAEFLRLQQIHKTDAAIAKVLGITRQRVHQIRAKLEIQPRKHPKSLQDNRRNKAD